MIKFKSLNSRLLFAFASLTIIVCLFFVRLTSVLIEISEQNAYRSLLGAQVEAYKKSETGAGFVADKNTTLYFDATIDIPAEFEELKLSLEHNTSGDFYSTSGDHFLYERAHNQNNKHGIFVLNVSALKANPYMSGIQSVMFYSISVSVILLCLLSSWYLAKWLSTPIRKLTSDIKNQNNNSSLYGIKRKDEIGKLANALEQSYREIQSLLQREQNFTRDVSHELRTPITLIKNTIALNPDKTLGSDATSVVSQAAQELEQTVEVLLALARQENLLFASHAILPIIEKTVLNIYNSYPELVFDVKIDVDKKLQVIGNQYLISLLCQNLVNNGFYHSNSGGMLIYSKEKLLVFENKIAGSQARPYYQGLGHGQYLVKRMAQEMNWELTIKQNEQSYRVIIKTA